MPAGPPAFDPKSNSAARRFVIGTPGAVETAMSLRMRGVILALVSLTVAIVVGCELPIHPRDGSAVVQIGVAPDSVALDPSQTQGFVAVGRTAGGDSMAGDVTRTTSAGTLTPPGVSTPPTAAAAPAPPPPAPPPPAAAPAAAAPPAAAAAPAAPAAAAPTAAAAGRARLRRDRGEQRLRVSDRELVDAVLEQSRAAVRVGDAVLRQHPPVDRQLLRAGDGPDHHQQRQLLHHRHGGQRRAAAAGSGEDVEVVRRGSAVSRIHGSRRRRLRPQARRLRVAL